MKQRVRLALSLLSIVVLAGCGGSGSSTPPANSQLLSKNWQLALADQIDNQGNDFTGGLTAGFLLQKGNSVTGSFNYSIAPSGSTVPCAAGAASVSGTVNGPSVTLTATAGIQIFTLTATLSSDGATMMGTYSTTGGAPVAGGGTCGTVQTGAAWSAVSVPALTGSLQGNLHDGGVFTVAGSLRQGDNIGASSATVTGELFSDDYPCFSHASLQGTISGSSVLLSIISDSGSTIGQIGSNNGSVLAPAVVQQAGANGGLILRGTSLNGYTVTTSKCPGGAANPGDAGSICLGLGTTTGCAQPLSFSLSSITFTSQAVGTRRSQVLTLTNTDPTGASAGGLTLTPPSLLGEFNGIDNFQESDDCGSSPFSLGPGQSCTITVTFSPQQSCTKDPVTADNSVPPLRCPSPLQSVLTVADPSSPDGQSSFTVAIRGTGLSALVPLEAQLAFSAVGQGQSTLPQTVTLVSTSLSPVTILPAIPDMACVPSSSGTPLPGLQVVSPLKTLESFPDNSLCHFDLSTNGPPNFPITNDLCSGATINPGQTCTFSIAFAPQADLANANDLTTALDDYFLQLSSLQCTGSVTSFCEIDSGRVPIQIKWNNQSPLRISPSAGLDFGMQTVGTTTVQTFTLLNDPADPNRPTVNFVSISTSSNKSFSQTNTCGSSLPSGSSCTIDITFQPTKTGLAQDQLLIVTPASDPASGITQVIYLWGTGS